MQLVRRNGTEENIFSVDLEPEEGKTKYVPLFNVLCKWYWHIFVDACSAHVRTCSTRTNSSNKIHQFIFIILLLFREAVYEFGNKFTFVMNR